MRAWGRSLRPGHGAGDGPDVPLREHVQAVRGGSYVVEQASHRAAPSLTSLTTHRFANMGSHPDRRPRHPSDMADADWVGFAMRYRSRVERGPWRSTLGILPSAGPEAVLAQPCPGGPRET
jgi:hypothetical protein